MAKMIYVLIGGGIGSLGRYLFAGIFNASLFPMGTLFANLSGSFLIGLLWGLSERFIISPNLRVFVFIGILGGFTTFSSFSLETFHLFRDHEISRAFIYILLTNIIGITLVFIGYYLSILILNINK